MQLITERGRDGASRPDLFSREKETKRKEGKKREKQRRFASGRLHRCVLNVVAGESPGCALCPCLTFQPSLPLSGRLRWGLGGAVHTTSAPICCKGHSQVQGTDPVRVPTVTTTLKLQRQTTQRSLAKGGRKVLEMGPPSVFPESPARQHPLLNCHSLFILL